MFALTFPVREHLLDKGYVTFPPLKIPNIEVKSLSSGREKPGRIQAVCLSRSSSGTNNGDRRSHRALQCRSQGPGVKTRDR